jgi:hypothetical protein
LAEDALPQIAPPEVRPLRFRVTVECLTDGERVQVTTTESAHGFTVSPALMGRKVAAVIRGYRPARK